MRLLIPLALAALLTVTPAFAQDTDAPPACPEGQVETPEGCSTQAWVDDCPPDMVCAVSAYGPDDCIECSGPSRGPDDGSCDTCRGEAADLDAVSRGSPGMGAALLLVGLAALVAVVRRA